MHASTHCLGKTLSIAMYPVSNTEHSRLSYFHRYFVDHQLPNCPSHYCGSASRHQQQLHVVDMERGIRKGRNQRASPLLATVFFVSPLQRARIHIYTPPDYAREEKRRLQNTCIAHIRQPTSIKKKYLIGSLDPATMQRTKHTQGVSSNNLLIK